MIIPCDLPSIHQIERNFSEVEAQIDMVVAKGWLGCWSKGPKETSL